jgi:acetoacetyl-CoA synthetase
VSRVPPILWAPDDARSERATLTRYARWLAETRGVETSGYHDLWRWSTTDLEGFWASIWDFFEIQASVPYERVLGSRGMPGAEWFPGARLNYAEHVFRGRDHGAVAVRHASELRPLTETTWGELRASTRRLAAALRATGIGPGDRVVAYLPNVVEAVAAFHACASIGAVWSSCSPDFGVRSVVDRFAQIEPRVLLAVDGYRYGGRDHDRLDAVQALQRAIPSLERTVVLGYLDGEPVLDGLESATSWEDFAREGDDAALAFGQVPFDHPLWVLFSSGTTGLPKAIVHGHGGILLELSKEVGLHVDLQRDDRLLWFTTTGWMMWNFLNAALLTEGSIVLYDGNAGHPGLGRLWDLAAASGVTCFGTSASYIAACR